MSEAPVVLITGTRKGLGRFLAEHFVRQGAIVEGCSRTAPDWELEGYTHHLVDVSNEEAIRGMVGNIRKRHNRLDVLINNAGVASMNHVMLAPVETLDALYATNLRGVFLLCREAAKLMRRRSFGRIVTVSTVAVPMLLEGEALYAATKSAATTFTLVLARELADFGITCNVVGPPPLDTDLIKNVGADKIAKVTNRLVLKRNGALEDVSNVIDFFVKAESGSVTGQVIYLGGI